MGLNPCLGLAVTYEDGVKRQAFLAHMQPEANRSEVANELAQQMPDNFNAEMHVHITSERADDPRVHADQEARADQLISEIAAKYNFIDFDATNVHRHAAHSLSVSLDGLKVSTQPVTQNFTKDELNEMQRRMEADSSKVLFYR